MCTCLSQAAVINILRESGYSSDFELFGDELLCVQKKIFVPEPNYRVSICYRIINDAYNDPAVILLGITTVNGNLKGILISNYCNHIRRRPPVIIKKLAEYYNRGGENNIVDEYNDHSFTSEFHIHRQPSFRV